MSIADGGSEVRVIIQEVPNTKSKLDCLVLLDVWRELAVLAQKFLVLDWYAAARLAQCCMAQTEILGVEKEVSRSMTTGQLTVVMDVEVRVLEFQDEQRSFTVETCWRCENNHCPPHPSLLYETGSDFPRSEAHQTSEGNRRPKTRPPSHVVGCL